MTRRASVFRCAFAGFEFPPEVILLAVRWYLRYSLSYRDLEEFLKRVFGQVLVHGSSSLSLRHSS